MFKISYRKLFDLIIADKKQFLTSHVPFPMNICYYTRQGQNIS